MVHFVTDMRLYWIKQALDCDTPLSSLTRNFTYRHISVSKFSSPNRLSWFYTSAVLNLCTSGKILWLLQQYILSSGEDL